VEVNDVNLGSTHSVPSSQRLARKLAVRASEFVWARRNLLIAAALAAAVSVSFYRSYLPLIFVPSQTSAAYCISQFQSSGVPNTYTGLWAFADCSNVPVVPAIVIQLIVTLAAAILAAYLLLESLFDLHVPHARRNSIVSSLVILGLATALVLNPFSLLMNFQYSIGWVVMMNLALYALVQFSKSRLGTTRSATFLTLAALFLGMAGAEYPLALVFTPVVAMVFVLPGVWGSNRHWRLLLGSVVAVFSSIAFVLLPSEWVPGLSGSSLPSQSAVVIHAANLEEVYLGQAFSRWWMGAGGINVLSLPPPPFEWVIAAVSISVIMVVFLWVVSTSRPWQTGVPVGLVAAMAVILLLNAYDPSTGLSLLSSSEIPLLQSGLLTTGSLSAILTAFDSNRLLLTPYWYVFTGLLGFAYFQSTSAMPEPAMELRKHPGKESRRSSFRRTNRAVFRVTPRAGQTRGRLGYNLSLAQYSLRRSAWVRFAAVASLLLLLSVEFVLPFQPYVGLPPTGTPMYDYGQSTGTPQYNQLLYLQNTSVWPNDLAAPLSIGPTGEDFSFYNNFVQNILPSPTWHSEFASLPPGTIVGAQCSTMPGDLCISSPDTSNSSYDTSNFQNANAVLGQPILVVGSQQAFDSFYNQQSQIPVLPDTTITGSLNTSNVQIPIPTLNQELINQSFPLLVNVSLHFSGTGTYVLSGFCNSTIFWVGGSANPFFGLAAQAGETGTQTWTFYQFNQTSTNTAFVQEGSFLNFTLEMFHVGESTVFFAENNGVWSHAEYVGSANFGFVRLRVVDTGSSNGTFSVDYTNVNLTGRELPILPVFYDSYFGSLTNFDNTLSQIHDVFFGPAMSSADVIHAREVWSPGTSISLPAQFAISRPANGWTQAFLTSTPQAAYFAGSIPEADLPDVFGYQLSFGYAVTNVLDSEIVVPITNSAVGGSVVLSMNVLCSPAGGTISVDMGNRSTSISTVSTYPHFSWIDFSLNSAPTSITVRDTAGSQMLGPILTAPYSVYEQSNSFVSNWINGSQVYNLTVGRLISTGTGEQLSIQGSFKIDGPTGALSIISPTRSPIAVEFPTDVNYAVAVHTIDSEAVIIPVWGNFFAVMLTNLTSQRVSFTINAPVSYYLTPTLAYVPLAALGVFLLTLRVVKRIKTRGHHVRE
jgi:hypothetical protein